MSCRLRVFLTAENRGPGFDNEIASLHSGTGMFGAAGAVVLGAAAVGLFLLFGRKKR